ncbi:cholinesterase precursor [Xylariomycetidae sp. FL2044]|nr:cholinesterase precursor [Xylariomycetidae sp. FL2044]
MLSLWSSAASSLLFSVLSVWAASTDHPQVHSTSDEIIGHRSPNRPSTFEFLGIKYGQPPVSTLRFAAPRLYTPAEDTVYNASNWNPDCPANIPAVTTFPNFTGNGFTIYNQFTAHNNNTQNEDCLALNIWTKSLPTSNFSSNKPVFVSFHGGRFTIPGPHSAFYNGQYFADAEDVVVVTVNYRLGIFGFSGAPGLTQNVGLLDQRLAVEWVRDNIAAFGGDPSRIIIFGQSAGGAAVDYWAYAYADDPIAAGLISHSGTAFSFVANNMSYAESLFLNVSQTLGCGGSGGDDDQDDDEEVVSCVRNRDVASVLAAARAVPGPQGPALSQTAFHPTVDNATVFSLATYTARSGAGDFARIPYLAGNADYEAGFYRVSAYAGNGSLSADGWELFNQRAFTCPTKYAAEARAAAAGVPTWRYRYMGGGWANLGLYGAYDGYPDSGAYHGSELSLLFGTTYDITGTPDTPEEELASRYIMGAWAAFGRDPTKGLSAYGWPSYYSSSNKSSSLVELAYENRTVPRFVDPVFYDSICPPVEQNDPLPGIGAF